MQLLKFAKRFLGNDKLGCSSLVRNFLVMTNLGHNFTCNYNSNTLCITLSFRRNLNAVAQVWLGFLRKDKFGAKFYLQLQFEHFVYYFVIPQEYHCSCLSLVRIFFGMKQKLSKN